MDVCDVIIGRLVRQIGKYQMLQAEALRDGNKDLSLIYSSKQEAMRKAIDIIREENDY